MKYLCALFLLLASLGPAFAVEPSERLANPALEARAEALGSQLRCLVCQNESIEESSAPLAHDLRLLIRRHIADGDSNAQIIKYLTARYGDFILLKPPVEPATYALWFGPVAVLLLAGGGALFYMRRRKAAPEPAPLSPQERDRLEQLLHEGEG